MSDRHLLAEPPVYKAVRAVGTLKPKFQPNPKGTIFADTLDVRGTAFWLKEYRIMVTCAHVVRDLVVAPIEITGLLVVGNKGNYARATVGLVDFDHDLALLHLPDDVPGEIAAKESADGLGLADSYEEIGASVSYAGFPLGTRMLGSTHAPTYAEGVVGGQIRRQPRRLELQVTGAVVGGFSGAPVVSKKHPDKLLGVLSNSPSKEAGDAHIFMAISWEHVFALAELARSGREHGPSATAHAPAPPSAPAPIAPQTPSGLKTEQPAQQAVGGDSGTRAADGAATGSPQP